MVYFSLQLKYISFQVARRKKQAQKPSGQRRGDGTEGIQGARSGLLHVRPVLGALFHTEYNIRSVPRLQGAAPRCRGVPVVGLRQLDHQPYYLHDIQQDVQGRIYQTAPLQVPEVNKIGCCYISKRCMLFKWLYTANNNGEKPVCISLLVHKFHNNRTKNTL